MAKRLLGSWRNASSLATSQQEAGSERSFNCKASNRASLQFWTWTRASTKGSACAGFKAKQLVLLHLEGEAATTTVSCYIQRKTKANGCHSQKKSYKQVQPIRSSSRNLTISLSHQSPSTRNSYWPSSSTQHRTSKHSYWLVLA